MGTNGRNLIHGLKTSRRIEFSPSQVFININEAHEHLQMEYVDCKRSSVWNKELYNFPLLELYQKKIFSQEKYPGIRRYTIFITSLFGVTYLCEQVFSMKHVTCLTRSCITDNRLESFFVLLCHPPPSPMPDIGSVLFVRSSV